jgi:ribosomal protein S18 acetylase RimI-like enzyme
LNAEVRPLRPTDVGWLAELHNVAFGDYPVPAVLDEQALRQYLLETDVDLALSRVAMVDERPASFCLGALRDGRASIRGEGTVPGYRRRGLGRRVLEETLEALAGAGAGEVCLEVLNGNDGAVHLYQQSGFERQRRLLGYSLMRPRARGVRDRLGGRPSSLAIAEALARISGWGWNDPPWQLQPASLAHLPALAFGRHAVAIGKGRGDRFWLYALAVDPARRRHGLATRALAHLPAAYIGVPALLPEDWWEAGALLRALGAMTESHWQWEMWRAL